MRLDHRSNPLKNAAVAGVFALSALSLTACGGDTSGPETDADVGDIQDVDTAYDGLYDAGFYGELDSYEGETVTVSADVNEVISPTSFIIAGTEDTTVEPLLIVGADEMNDLEEEMTVAVTGVVHKSFDVAEAEEELGVELDDGLYEDWGGDPYIAASSVDTSVPADE